MWPAQRARFVNFGFGCFFLGIVSVGKFFLVSSEIAGLGGTVKLFVMSDNFLLREIICYSWSIVMTKKMLIFLCVLGMLMISIGAVLYFIPPYAQSSSVNLFQDYSNNSTFPVLIVRAWNDAEYSLGSRTWMFLYEPSFDSPHELNLAFPFPFPPLNPGVDKIYGGKPALFAVCKIVGDNPPYEGGVMNATTGTSGNWDGVMETTVVVANPSIVFLVFKPLP